MKVFKAETKINKPDIKQLNQGGSTLGSHKISEKKRKIDFDETVVHFFTGFAELTI